MKAYIGKKIFGDVWAVFLLAVPPALWGLLAFNPLLLDKTGVLPGEPLGSNSISIVMLRLGGAAALGILLGLILLLVGVSAQKLHLPSCISAFNTFLKAHFVSMVWAAVFLALNLVAFFAAFDLVGVVMTNILVAGFVPIFSFLGVLLAPHWRQRRGLSAQDSNFGIYDVGALALLVLSLVLFLLMTFDTFDVFKWVDIMKDRKPPDDTAVGFSFNLVGVLCCIFSGLMWNLYLRSVSAWPTQQAEDIDPNNPHAPRTVESLYVEREQMRIPDAEVSRPKLSVPVTFLVKVGLVQGLAFVVALVFVANLSPFSGLSGSKILSMCAETVGDFMSLPSSFGDFLSPKGALFAAIVLVCSLGAYFALNQFSALYNAKKRPVSSGQWNDLLAFFEPLVATIIGIFVLGYFGHSERHIYGNLAVPIVCVVLVSYLLVFLVRFYGLFDHQLKTDSSAYAQKLEKLHHDALSVDPTAATDEELMTAGAKTQDIASVTRVEESNPSIREKMLTFLGNMLEQARLHLAYVCPGRPSCRYRTVDHQADATPTKLTSLCVEFETLAEEDKDRVWSVLCANFDPLAENWQNEKRFHVGVVLFPKYAAELPAYSDTWREIEKAIYFYLTGSVWHKTRRFRGDNVSETLRALPPERWQEVLNRRTRKFVNLVDQQKLADHLAQPQAGPTQLGWSELFFPAVPHLLDWDHMLGGDREALVGLKLRQEDCRATVGTTDKLGFLLIPTNPNAIPGIEFTNPLWQDCPRLDGANLVPMFHKKWVELLNDCAAPEKVSEFRRQFPSNAWILARV